MDLNVLIETEIKQKANKYYYKSVGTAIDGALGNTVYVVVTNDHLHHYR